MEKYNKTRKTTITGLNVVFSGWRKSEKNKVRDQLLLDALVSFVRKRDTGLKF